MKFIIDQKQLEILSNHIQNLIDSELNSIREESEEWGLGEMDELDEINSVNDITIDRLVPHTSIKVYINIHTDSSREEFDNIRAELQYRLEQWIPSIKLFINEISPS